jgi:nicotinamidase-related amidase
MEISSTDTAVVFIDPQNDVLSEHGANWGAVGASVTENRTVENMARIFEAAKAHGHEVFISPHYFYPTDSGWHMNGPLDTDEFETRTFARAGQLDLTGFEGSGADWLDRFKPYIEDGKTVVVSPHKVFGPQTNDLTLQLRKRGIAEIILGGMLANMCVESHLRELVEQGFEVATVRRHRRSAPSGMGRRLSGGDDQLPLLRPRGAVDRGRSRTHGSRRLAGGGRSRGRAGPSSGIGTASADAGCNGVAVRPRLP